MRIYCDGIFDLFHVGHIKTLEYIKNMFDNVTVIVGVISDEDAEKYKRKPIINEIDRGISLKSCRFVDEIIQHVPLIINEYFLLKNNIDLVVHGFYNQYDKEKQKEFFKIPIKLNKFKEIPYSHVESTSGIIDRIVKQFKQVNICDEL